MRHQRRVTAGQPERTHRAAVRREGSTPRQTVAFLLAAALVSGAIGTWWLVRSAGRVLDGGLVAVAPLALGALALEPAAPGIERDLAAAITAGGGLRAVPAAAAHAACADSTRLVARLLDISHNRVLAMVEVRAARGRQATLGGEAGAQLRAHLPAQPSSSSR